METSLSDCFWFNMLEIRAALDARRVASVIACRKKKSSYVLYSQIAGKSNFSFD
jgi:hypothetical protein